MPMPRRRCVVVEAQIDEMAGDKAAAETKYRRAVELDPSALRVVLTAADGLRRLGKADDARAILKAFGDKYSDSVVMDGLLARQRADAQAAVAGVGHRRDHVRDRQRAERRPAQPARRPRPDLRAVRGRAEARSRLRLADHRRPLRAVGQCRPRRWRLQQGRSDLAAVLAGAPARGGARCPGGALRRGGRASCKRAGGGEARAHRRRADPGRAAAQQGDATPTRSPPTTPRSSASRRSRSAIGRSTSAAASCSSAPSSGPRPRPT